MRTLLLFTIPFALGTALCQYLLPAAWQGWLSAALLLVGFGAARLMKERRFVVMLTATALTLGMMWFVGYSQLFLAPAEALVGTEDTVTMELLEYPEEKDYGARCTVRVLDRGLLGRAVYYGDPSLLELEPGTRLTAAVKFYSAVTVGGQSSTYYTSRDIFLRMYDQGGAVTVELGNAGSLRYLPQRLSLQLRGAVDEIFPMPSAGFVTALLTGERENLDEQTLTDLEESGLMHITAVSGLHCGFFISFLSVLLARRQRLTALIAYPLLLLYMVMVGCTPSVVRACIMVGLTLFAPLLKREGDTPTSLAAAALVILLANPFAVASVSFQMSFGAVAGLLWAAPGIYRALGGGVRRKSRAVGTLWNFAAGAVAASLGSLIFVAPLSAVYFGFFSLVAPLTNLLVLWVAPVLFALAFLVSALCAFWPGLAFLALLPELLTRYVLWTANAMAKVPGHGVYFTGDVMLLWLVFVYGMLAVCALYRCGWRPWALAVMLALVTLAAARMYPVLMVEDDTMTLLTVDVGQGAATLLHSGDATALVDCGTHYSLRGAGGLVADAMATYGWDTLDYVVLTHYHTDHAGGLEGLLARVEVDRLLLPELSENHGQSPLQQEVLTLAERYGVAVDYVQQTESIPLGGGELTLYPPMTAGDTNEEGLAVLGTWGEFDVLITGDMSSATERRLLERYELPDTEVLLVGHHGSKNSTSDDLLRAVMPEVGIISVGENNYGHPTYEAMERMAFYGMTLYRTDLQGNVLIRVN